MSFKDYCKNEKINEQAVNLNKKQEQKVEELYDKYKDKSEDELMSELLNNVSKQKQEGSFNLNAIEQTLEKLSPFLNAEQNIKLKDLLQKIK